MSRWRRRTGGNMTRAFGFGAPPRRDTPRLPETAAALRGAEAAEGNLPQPEAPLVQAMSRQETGTGLRRVREPQSHSER